MAYTANRAGIAERLPTPAGQKRIAVALALLGHYAPWRRDIKLSSLKAATPDDADTLY